MNNYIFNIKDIVFFVIDEMNEPFIVVGKIDRGDCKRYLVSNKDGEKEVAEFEITSEKIIR